MPTIWFAAKLDNLAEVERHVDEEPGLLDAQDDEERTPLIYAAQEGHVGVALWLVEKGAAIDVQDYEGSTALWWACHNGNISLVRLLMRRGADPTIANSAGWTPLIAACAWGQPEITRLLLGHPSVKASINRRNDDGQTALWMACKRGRVAKVRALLENGADLTVADREGITPMAIAKRDLTWEEQEDGATAEGRRECVAALKVRSRFLLFIPQHLRF
jgi:ankyrin repeat protein